MAEISEVRVEPKMPWSAVIELGKTLTITDLEGQQAVDFLCYDADDLTDRFSATNTIKVQGNIYIEQGSVLRADSGKPLFTVDGRDPSTSAKALAYIRPCGPGAPQLIAQSTVCL